jgi:hypothetical protein
LGCKIEGIGLEFLGEPGISKRMEGLMVGEGLSAQSEESWVFSFWLWVLGLEYMVEGLGCAIYGLGFRV